MADLNGDGKPDLVVGNRNANTVSILLGNGNGTFQAPVTLGAGKNRYSAAVADLTGDGKSRRRHDQRAPEHRDRAARQRRRHLRARQTVAVGLGADVRGGGAT